MLNKHFLVHFPFRKPTHDIMVLWSIILTCEKCESSISSFRQCTYLNTVYIDVKIEDLYKLGIEQEVLIVTS